jgi:hypothetical protein
MPQWQDIVKAAYLCHAETLPLYISRLEDSVFNSSVQAFDASTVYHLLTREVGSLLEE